MPLFEHGTSDVFLAELDPNNRTSAVDGAATARTIVGPGFRLAGGSCLRSADGRAAVSILENPSASLSDPAAANELNEAVLEAFLGGATAIKAAQMLPNGVSCVMIDGAAQRLIVIGDRMGMQRLYYNIEGPLITVSNDPTLVPASQSTAPISDQAIFDYVYFHVVPAPRSAAAGIAALPIGSALTVNGGMRTVEPCRTMDWTPAYADVEKTSKQMIETLRAAVAASLPVGATETACFLSGGLDSSSVAGAASTLLGGSQVHAFSIGFREPEYDESEFAEAAARHFDLDWHRHELTPEEVSESIDAIVGAMPEPFGNSSAVAVYHCALQAKKLGFDFMLAGDGGDEIFGGNFRYAKQLVFERYRKVPAAFRRTLLEPTVRALAASTNSPIFRKAQSYIEQANVPLPDRMQSYNYLHRNRLDDIFTDSFLGRVDPDEPMEMMRTEYASCPSTDPVARMMQLDWRFALHDNDLVKVNSMCGLADVEVAYPMLQESMVDFAGKVPGDWRIRKGELRWFYRNAMRGFLPDKIIDKKKHGFGLPFGVWTRTHADLRNVAETSISHLGKRGIFRQSFLQETLEKHRNVHAGYYGELIWILMILELWLQKQAPDFGL